MKEIQGFHLWRNYSWEIMSVDTLNVEVRMHSKRFFAWKGSSAFIIRANFIDRKEEVLVHRQKHRKKWIKSQLTTNPITILMPRWILKPNYRLISGFETSNYITFWYFWISVKPEELFFSGILAWQFTMFTVDFRHFWQTRKCLNFLFW